MLKLLFTLGAFLMLSLAVLGLRHRRLEITSQTVKLQDQIMAREQSMWDQKVQIAEHTNPLALAVNLKTQGMSPGAALLPREARTTKPRTGTTKVETDLVAPIRDTGSSGHSDPRRPRIQ